MASAAKAKPVDDAASSPASVAAAHAQDALAPAVEPVTVPPKIVKVRVVCGTCPHYRPERDDKSIGQCLASSKVLAAPLRVLDLSSCSKHPKYTEQAA